MKYRINVNSLVLTCSTCDAELIRTKHFSHVTCSSCKKKRADAIYRRHKKATQISKSPKPLYSKE